ncbi:MAG: YeeE/YedE family protein [Thiogranum sp.]|nr:YeeE/YedE family protein [Thiogranum sp.]
MIDYLPWWIGALALSSIVIGFWLSIGRPLGVSGSWARIVMWKEDKTIEQAEAPFRANPEMLKDALMKATIQHFGEAAVYAALSRRGGKPVAAPADHPASMEIKATWTMHAAFLAMLAAGGLAASLMHGPVELRFNLDELHAQMFGSGIGYLMTLFVGGAMVGFGTQLGGGCTSGHGLSGCSRLVPASLIATASFFGTAVAVSLLIHFFGGA